jgi:hypothetical protein
MTLLPPIKASETGELIYTERAFSLTQSELIESITYFRMSDFPRQPLNLIF